VAEHDRRHVEAGEPADARPGRGVVVAEERAREDDASTPALEDVAGERQVPVAVSARVRACPHTHSLVPATVAALAAMGVVSVTVEVVGESAGAWDDERAAAKAGSSAPLDRAWVAAVVDSGVVNRAWVTIEGARGDGAVPAGGAGVRSLLGARAWHRCEAPR